MTLTKVVNGVRVNMSAEEEAARRAESDANAQAESDYQDEFGYLDRRRTEYPPTQQSIEAIYAGFKTIKDGDSGIVLPQLTLDWIAQIESIDAANPPPL